MLTLVLVLVILRRTEFKGFAFNGPVPPSVSPQREDKPFGSTDEEWPLIAEMQERLRVDGVRSRPNFHLPAPRMPRIAPPPPPRHTGV